MVPRRANMIVLAFALLLMPISFAQASCADGIDNDADGFRDFRTIQEQQQLQSQIAQGETSRQLLINGYYLTISLMIPQLQVIETNLALPYDPIAVTQAENSLNTLHAQFVELYSQQDALRQFILLLIRESLVDPDCISPSDDENHADGPFECHDFQDNDGDGMYDYSTPQMRANRQEEFMRSGTGIQDLQTMLVSIQNSRALLQQNTAALQAAGVSIGTLNFMLDTYENNVNFILPGIQQSRNSLFYLMNTDLDCDSPYDDSEASSGTGIPECSDGVDNDGDGLVDLADPNCENSADDSEGPFSILQSITTFVSNVLGLSSRDLRIDAIHLIPDTVHAGEQLVVAIQAENEFRREIDELSVRASVPELDLFSARQVEDVKRGNTETFTFVLDIPDDTPSGEYMVRVALHAGERHRVRHRPFIVI